MLTLVTSLVYQISISEVILLNCTNQDVIQFKFNFSIRVVDVWNRLDQRVIDSCTTNLIKNNQNKYLNSWRFI